MWDHYHKRRNLCWETISAEMWLHLYALRKYHMLCKTTFCLKSYIWLCKICSCLASSKNPCVSKTITNSYFGHLVIEIIFNFAQSHFKCLWFFKTCFFYTIKFHGRYISLSWELLTLANQNNYWLLKLSWFVKKKYTFRN